MENSRKCVIAGIIMPHSWDENGRVTEIALYTDKEAVYAVEDNRLTRALMDHMQMTVEIKGKVRKHPDGNRSIAAVGYKLLK